MQTFTFSQFTITINSEHFEYYHELFDNVQTCKCEQDIAHLFETYLIESTILEKDVINKNAVKAVSEYIASINIPDIRILYSTLLPDMKQCFRSPTDVDSGFVGVGKNVKQWCESFYHIGIRSSELDITALQELVNEYYAYEFDNEYANSIVGFACYLLYERIHPHHDGNGRMGRMLFIENTHSKEYFPLSIMLRRLHKPEIMEQIFKIVSFPDVVYNSDRVVHYHDSAEYYTLNIDDKLLRLITKCILPMSRNEIFVYSV